MYKQVMSIPVLLLLYQPSCGDEDGGSTVEEIPLGCYVLTMSDGAFVEDEVGIGYFRLASHFPQPYCMNIGIHRHRAYMCATQ